MAIGEFFRDVYLQCEQQNVPADTAVAENGVGQFEINLLHTNDALKAAVKDPDFIRKQDAGGATVITDSRNDPAGHKAFVMSEVAKWAPVIRAAGVYAD